MMARYIVEPSQAPEGGSRSVCPSRREFEGRLSVKLGRAVGDKVRRQGLELREVRGLLGAIDGIAAEEDPFEARQVYEWGEIGDSVVLGLEQGQRGQRRKHGQVGHAVAAHLQAVECGQRFYSGNIAQEVFTNVQGGEAS